MIEKRFLFSLLDYNIGRFDCASSPNTCTDLFIFKRPAFVLFKRNGHYEFYYGNDYLFEKREMIDVKF